MGLVGERSLGMSIPNSRGPEWISQTLVDATILNDDGSREPVVVKVGIVRLPNGGGRRVASQLLGEDRPLVLLPPKSIARIMGALRSGIFTL